MTRALLFACALALTAAPLAADEEGAPVTAEAFEAYVTGKTLTFDYGEGLFGTEQYLPGRQVRWAFDGGRCLTGRWYPEGTAICFVYEGNSADPQCWRFTMPGGRLAAQFLGQGADGAPGSFITESGQSTAPLPCAGPDVGV